MDLATPRPPALRAHHRAGAKPSPRRAALPAAASSFARKSTTCKPSPDRANCQPKTNTRILHRNQQYSIIALTDGTGAIQERYAYSAYGEPFILSPSISPLATSNFSNRYTYTGREWDEELSLYHFRARMYDAVSGRFYGRDPLRYTGSKSNFYCSLGNNPVNRLDPTGLVDVGAICRRVALTKFQPLRQLVGKHCPGVDVQPQCVVCDREGTLGYTECHGGRNPSRIDINICVDTLENVFPNANEKEVIESIVTTMIHENIHVLDQCTCKAGCNLLKMGAHEVVTRNGRESFCRRYFCSEVHAHLVDGSCDHVQGEPEKKQCLRKILTVDYTLPRFCKVQDIDAAIDECYFDGANIPFPMPTF